MTAKALGFLRKDLAADPLRDAVTIRELADQHDYFLINTLKFDSSARTAGLVLVQSIQQADAAAVITPSLDHVATLKRAITELCDLVTPQQTYERGHKWPSQIPTMFPSGM
jgi:2,3-bisphosphoglycerate-independent phosphoglycerate mutase